MKQNCIYSMQSIEQRYYRETEEHNYNGCKLLVKKDDMLAYMLYAISGHGQR